jgi:hypothetical protein
MHKSNPPPNWIVGICVLLVFILVAIASSLEKAFAFSMTFGVFAAIIQTKWESRTDWRFWSILSIFAGAHLLAIYLVHFPRPQLALTFVPVAMIDGFAMWGLINWIERRFPKEVDSSER